MTTVEPKLDTLNGAACEAVIRQAICSIHADGMLSHLAALPQAKLTAWCREAESGLQMWVAGWDSAIIDRIYYELGRAGAVSGIPVPELIRALGLVLNLGRSRLSPNPQSTPHTDVPDPLATFSDYAKYYLIRGFEDALR